MSARRKRPRGAGDPAVPTPPPPQVPEARVRGPARKLALGGLALALLAAGLVALWPRGSDPQPGERVALPPPSAAPAAAGPAFADFVGSDACAQCHQTEYQQWQGSTHARAGGRPDEVRVVAPFDGTPIRFRDAVVVPARAPGGEYVFRVRWQDLPEQVLRVDAVVGGGHMEGGGTQGFLSRHPDGTLRFLPFDFARQQGVWFCNTGTRKNAGWVPITEALSLADCGDWPPQRVLGESRDFSNCQGCHGSQVQLEFDDSVRTYRTRFQTLAINCESCHGPGREHVELARSGSMRDRRDVRMQALATLGKDASVNVCLQCHSLKDQIAEGHLPGRPLEQHFSLSFPILGERPYYPDGRTRTFAYQEGHRASDCYLNGSMTCVDCHSPHSQSYRDHTGQPLQGRFSDGQCTSCHASKAERPEAHTFHPAGSTGSRCVSCHMPYLQQPEVGEAVRYGRSDHTIPVPRPASDAALGVQSACQQCHTQRTPAELQRQVATWWGELKPRKPLVEGLSDTEALRDRRRAAERLLRPEDRFPMAQFAGISFMLENHLEPDMPELEPEIVARLRQLAGSADLDVRALALATLHLARGEDPGVRRWLADELGRLQGAEERAIRGRWALALGAEGDRYRVAQRPREASLAYGKALEITPDDPQLLLALGLAQAASGDLNGAVTRYRRVVQLDPTHWLALVNLGAALEQLGDADGALRAYETAIERNPHHAMPYVNLGSQWLRRGQPASAAGAYQQAVRLDPGLALAHFYLARAYILVGEYPRALAAVRQGMRFDPNDATAQQMLRDLERALAGP